MKKQPSVLVMQTWLNYRGAEMQSLQMSEDFRNLGCVSSLLCLFITDAVVDRVDQSYIVVPSKLVQRLLQNKFLFFVFGFWVMLVMTLRVGRRYTVFNPHNFPCVWVAVIVAFVYRKKVVWTVHNYPQHPFVGIIARMYEWVIRPFDFFLVRRVHMVVSVSKKVARQTVLRYGVSSTVVYPGIDVLFYSRSVAPEREISFLEGRKVLLHVGRMTPRKGQQISVDIFTKLAVTDSRMILVFIGEGSSSFLSLPEQAIRERIFFVGAQARRSMGWWYAHADYLLSPYFESEGCTAVPLEAALVGCYPIVALESGVDEILIDNQFGYVFDPSNGVDEVCSHILKITHRGHAVYRALIEKYDRMKCATDYLDKISVL